MNTKFMMIAVFAMTATAWAANEADRGLVKAEERGRWTFSAGPAWRSQVKMKTHGTLIAPAPVEDWTDQKDMTDQDNWIGVDRVNDPNAGKGGVPADGKLWGISDTYTKIYGIRGADYSVRTSDEDSPLGLNLQGCYDFLQGETWSLGLNLRFAGYWNMKSSSHGCYNAGSTVTETLQNDYIFPNEDASFDAKFEPNPYTLIEQVNDEPIFIDSMTDTLGSRAVSTRLRTDLYQIGLGPKLTWSPFVGWCDALKWLDVYGGVEVLCNIAHSEFKADGRSSTENECLLGFGGNVGFVGNITENIGIFGQVGYEWIDESNVSAGGFKADIDYSSLVVSVGVQFRF